MQECIKNLKEALDLSLSLIGDVILLEKLAIDNKYTESDFFDKYIHIATILDSKVEKTIYRYSTSLDFFIDMFKDIASFLDRREAKDYKAIFVDDIVVNKKENKDIIKALLNSSIRVYWITSSLLIDGVDDRITLIDLDKRSEYLKHLNALKLEVSRKYKKQFYLEIIKQNHEIEFSNYLALKSKLKELEG